MKRFLQLVLVLCVLAGLGAVAGIGVGAAHSASSVAADATDPTTASSTDPTTDTTPATTTDTTPTTTDTTPTTTDVTTTDTTPTTTDTTPATTDTTPTTTGTPPSETETMTSTPAPVTQSTPESTSTPTTTVTSTQPCQTPSNPGVTCGNNAATQVAVVTQNCQSSSTIATGGLSIEILDSTGKVEKTLGVDNHSVCLNYSQITQIVDQICVGCTLVVQNYYSSTTTNTTVVPNWDGPHYLGYCMPANEPVQRGDGTVGWLVFLQAGRPGWDPVYRDAKPATFDPVNGYSCPGTTTAPVPNTFTLTVPAAFVGRYINLCIQTIDAEKPACHSVLIDSAAAVTIPVSSNVTASITKTPRAKVSRTATDAAAALLHKHARRTCTTAKTHARKHHACTSKMAKKTGRVP